MKLVYLATPYSHSDPAVMEWRYQCAMRAAARLMGMGFVVFSPIAHSHEIGKHIGRQAGGNLDHDTHAFWMRQDLPWLERCDIVVVLRINGWQESRGVREEIEYAEARGKTIEYWTMEGLGAELPPVPAADPVETQTFGPLAGVKDTNPKDMVGTRKVPISTLPIRVLWRIGLAMLEGACKYGRHNYRWAGVRASVYFDAAVGRHLFSWWEGEDIDAESNLSHIDKAIAALMVLRDSMLEGNWVDDRPPRGRDNMAELNAHASTLLDRYADRNPRHYTIADTKEKP